MDTKELVKMAFTDEKLTDIKTQLEDFCPHYFDDETCLRCDCECPVDICLRALRQPH